MMRQLLSLALCIGCTMFAHAGCSDCEDCGKVPGGDCNDGWAGTAGYCDDGMKCVNDVCELCGGAGQACCPASGIDDCDGTLACVEEHDAPSHCESSCGEIGEPCCDNAFDGWTGTCPVSGLCDGASNTCVPGGGTSSPCGSGGASHFVEILDANGCVKQTYFFNSDNPDACIAAYIEAQWGPNSEYKPGPLDDQADCEDVCQHWEPGPGDSTLHLCAMNDQAMQSCKTAQCTNCDYTDGACPP